MLDGVRLDSRGERASESAIKVPNVPTKEQSAEYLTDRSIDSLKREASHRRHINKLNLESTEALMNRTVLVT